MANSGQFRKGQSGNPAGKPLGAKDHHPRTAAAAVRNLLDEFGNDVELIRDALTKGLRAKAPSSFPYLRMVVEHHAGSPEQTVTHRVPNIVFKEYVGDR